MASVLESFTGAFGSIKGAIFGEPEPKIPEIKGQLTELPGPKDAIQALKDQLEGRLFTIGDDYKAYEAARIGTTTKFWNHDVLARPVAIATCKTKQDVVACIKFYTQYCHNVDGITLNVAGGRHSSMCFTDNAFAIDLSMMKKVTVNVEESWCDAEGGALWADVLKAGAPHSLAVTGGTATSTGIGGLTVQGGHGFLERTFGLTIDNVLEYEIVTATGEVIVASETKNSDLFWAQSGGGANFGVITRFRYRLHKVPELMFAGQRIHVPLGTGSWFPDRGDLIEKYSKLTVESGNDNSTGVLILPVGGPVVELLVYTGDPVEGAEFYKPHFKNSGFPVRNTCQPRSYFTDVSYMPPDHPGNYYMSGIMSKDMTPELADTLSELAQSKNAPGSGCTATIICMPLGGVAGKKKPEESAFAHRDARWWFILEGEWTAKPGTDAYSTQKENVIKWIRKAQCALKAFKFGNYAVGSEVATHGEEKSKDDAFVTRGEIAKVMNLRNIYGGNLPRLQKIKHKYDPTNLFVNCDNILPKP